jgi:hypothetical protein
LLVCGIGLWRHENSTIRSGVGLLLAGIALPTSFYLVTATLAQAACGRI